ncbi:phytoene desaturase family protein [Marispirochaeta aestuarii]|uniref:phytoene desaturase family protein n=1 Tax=Marispirochaeta aestuarii TaxID=1963862 RepID=UPI0029C947AB|nr:phytoene desaturase family protein [Marispirochaeta aestuarii]
MGTRALVIGAGLGGIAAAGYLAAAGFDVGVFEQAEGPGGKAGSEMIGPYRFDTGPSLLTMPFVFDEWFTALGMRRSEHLGFVPLAPITRYFFSDGSGLQSYSQREMFLDEIRSHTRENPEHVHGYLEACRKIYTTAGSIFLRNSLHEKETWLSREFLRALPGLPFIGAMTKMDSINRRYFTDPRLVQLFNRYATYNGSSPYKTPGTMTLIPHVEYNLGAFGVEGGIRAIPDSMYAAAREKGAVFHFSSPVEKILTEGYRVRGIQVGGERIESSVVVSNADVLSTYEKLLTAPDSPEARRYRALEPSSSGIVFYWGVKKSFPGLGLHNIFFSSDYPAEFRWIFEKGDLPEDLTIYINITSKLSTADAPGERENWFVLINAPADCGQDWQTITRKVRRRVLEKLSSRLGIEILPLLEAEGILTPPEIESRTSSTHGSLYGIASNSISASFRRHRNRCRYPEGLYFCGGSAHPGGGMPLVVLSGIIAAKLAIKNRRP